MNRPTSFVDVIYAQCIKYDMAAADSRIFMRFARKRPFRQGLTRVGVKERGRKTTTPRLSFFGRTQAIQRERIGHQSTISSVRDQRKRNSRGNESPESSTREVAAQGNHSDLFGDVQGWVESKEDDSELKRVEPFFQDA